MLLGSQCGFPVVMDMMGDGVANVRFRNPETRPHPHGCRQGASWSGFAPSAAWKSHCPRHERQRQQVSSMELSESHKKNDRTMAKAQSGTIAALSDVLIALQ